MRKVEIDRQRYLLNDVFRVEEVFLRFEKFDGTMSNTIRRLNFDRGDSVAVLVYNLDTQKLLLIEQFRYPTYHKGPGWIIETIAGIVDEGEPPEETARREAHEETGLNVENVEFIASFYPSPGGSSERIFLYYVEISGENAKHDAVGGLAFENENIRTLEISLEDALEQVRKGEIRDVKTIMGIYWLENRFLTVAERTCFVIMPFGDKPDENGNPIHFDTVYEDFIKPTVEAIGIPCIRCDKIEESGGIHTKMFTGIYDADVSVVDITLRNPNVFYELGVRHALKRNVTIIIRQAGTQIPFNISGFTVVEYKSDDPVNQKQVAEEIQKMIKNGLANVKKADGPVYEALPNLKVENKSQLLNKKYTFSFSLTNVPGKQIGIITGDLQNVKEVDVWVNSENTNMQMARPYERSISGVIRYMGASKNKAGKIKEDTIANELKEAMEGETSVDPGTVLYTGAGDLTETNNVKKILHAASVVGQVGMGYSTIEKITECVRNSLEVLDDPKKLANENLHSILFPLMGTGTSKKSAQEVAADLIDEAISYLEENPQSKAEKVYFLAYSEQDLELCERIMKSHDRLFLPGT
jgi:nudix-type nucleoside diphosphatase (YffH/AdpP family)